MNNTVKNINDKQDKQLLAAISSRLAAEELHKQGDFMLKTQLEQLLCPKDKTCSDDSYCASLRK